MTNTPGKKAFIILLILFIVLIIWIYVLVKKTNNQNHGIILSSLSNGSVKTKVNKNNNKKRTINKPIRSINSLSISSVTYRSLTNKIKVYITKKRKCISLRYMSKISIYGLSSKLYDKYGIRTSQEYIVGLSNGSSILLVLMNGKSMNSTRICGYIGYMVINEHNSTFIIV